MTERSLIQRAWAGEALNDVPIIDMHCHLGNLYSFSIAKNDIEELISDADRLGVGKITISPHAALNCDYPFGNRIVRDAAERYPDRVYGYLTLNGNFPDEMERQFAEHAKLPQFIGVKLHPDMHRCAIDSDNSKKVFRLLTERGGFALVHTWYPSPYNTPAQCEKILGEFPTVPFIFGHVSGTPEGISQVERLSKKYDNLYIDTSGSEASLTSLEELARRFDPKKILFGSDAPYHDMRTVFARVAFAELSDRIKRDIFADNFLEMQKVNPKRLWAG